MNEFRCNDCQTEFKAAELPSGLCPVCGSDDISQTCPQCAHVIDDDTKYCPECNETVA